MLEDAVNLPSLARLDGAGDGPNPKSEATKSPPDMVPKVPSPSAGVSDKSAARIQYSYTHKHQ